jgi:hypothetical protein
MGPLVVISMDLPAGEDSHNGLWNAMGARSPPGKEVLAAPWIGR